MNALDPDKPANGRARRRARAALLAAGAAAVSAGFALSGMPAILTALLSASAALACLRLGLSYPSADETTVLSPPVPPQPFMTMRPDWLDALPFEALIATPDRIVSALSARARTTFPGLALGAPLSLALRDPDLLAAFDTCALDGKPLTIEWVEYGARERSFRVSFALVDDRILIVFESREALRAADRMRVDFIANASHELRTPLASLLGFIETLQGPARDDAAARKRFLGIMQEQALRMSRLVNDLLSLSRIEQRSHETPSEPVDLAAVVDETIDILRKRASDLDVLLHFDRPAGPAIVAGDRDELLRLADNLVENAIKYGRSGKHVAIALADEGGRLVFSVRDHGPGIPPEHLPRLTERFYRVDAGKSREAGGTGLGLALVKHIAQRHHARLAISNAEGGGARVTVSFPRL